MNPRDGALFIATHTGLFRSARDQTKSTRVADRYQDTMGFTVVGSDDFLGSGHPDGREGLPPFLGLIRSTDGGESWKPVSLLGEADFHLLEASGRRVYGYGSDFDTRAARFLRSSDGGHRWARLRPPEPLVSLAIAPDDVERLIAAGERGLHASADGGRTWRGIVGEPGLVAWVDQGLIVVDAQGRVWSARTIGAKWRERGSVGGRPAAFKAAVDGALYVALHDGTVKRSADGGRSWTVRSRP